MKLFSLSSRILGFSFAFVSAPLAAADIEGGKDYYTDFEWQMITEIASMKADPPKFATALTESGTALPQAPRAAAAARLRESPASPLQVALSLTQRLNVEYMGKGRWQTREAVGSACTGGIWYYSSILRGRGEPREVLERSVVNNPSVMGEILGNNHMGIHCAQNSKGEKFCNILMASESSRMKSNLNEYSALKAAAGYRAALHFGQGALEEIFQKKDLKALKGAFKEGLTAAVKYPGSETLLHIAARNGATRAMVEYLIEQGAALNELTGDGYTALQLAAREDNLGVVQALVEAGAELNYVRADGDTALSMAMPINEETNTSRYLRKRGAK